jgi:long-chain acyl-CoA synthetase
MQYQNVYQLFRAQTAKYRGRALFQHDPDGSGWRGSNWEEFEEDVHALACAFLANGLTPGASVAILAGNIPQWGIADLAAIAAGGVGVGIYPTSSAEQCEYIINHSEAEFVLVDSQKQKDKLLEIKSRLPKVKAIIEITGKSVESEQAAEEVEETQVQSAPEFFRYDEFIRIGRDRSAEFLPRVESIGNSSKLTDTAIMVYTSGTTGMPKGAMLSHKYILNSVESLRQTIPIFDDDVCFSYLPHCHVAERISGLYNRLYNGTSVYFVDDITKLYKYMLEVKPTVFASLPRFFEKIHAKLVADSNGGEIDAQTVKDAFGGRIRLLTSGGAALPNEVADFFARAGLPILQAYGLTENICVAFNRANDFKFGTVGKPMPMCEVKIAEDGEILISSPMMFSGYFKDQEKTAEMFNESGWLLTGDLGAIDDDGFLSITGRKKEIIVLSSGKNVAPNLVENYVKENHLISQCFLYGDGKSYCVALITLNQAEAEIFARANAIEFKDFAELASNSIIAENVENSVAAANSRLSSSEQIKTYKILKRDFSAELDEVTPTLKVKRNIVAQNFADEIAALYVK